MIKPVTRLLQAALCLVALSAPASAFEIETHKSPDGHEFAFVAMPDATQTVIRFVWKGGYAFVPSGKENIGALGPKLILEGGSGTLSPDALINALDALGGGLNLYSDPDALHGILTGTEGNLAATAALMHTALAEPAFDPRWLKRFQRGFVENVSARIKTASGQAWQTMREITVGDHPLRQAWSATPLDNLSSITIEDIKTWHQRMITASDVRVFAAGNAGADEIAKAIDGVLRGLSQEAAREDFPPLVMHYPAKTILVHRPDLEKSYLLVGGPLPKTYSGNQEAREIGIGVLGVSDQSRLFTAIRKNLRASYGFGAWAHNFSRENAMLRFQGEVDTPKLAEVLETVRVTYEDFRTGGIGRLEFPFAHRLFKNRAADMTDHPHGVINLIVEASLFGRSLADGLAYPERAAALSRAATNEVIAQDFPPFAEMVKIIVSPDRDAVQADCIIEDFSEAAACQ